MRGAAAIDAPERVTSIHGPWTVGEVAIGRYADLWRGSANDLGGTERPPDQVVWRIDLTNPDGAEELYPDATTDELVDAISQGR